MGDVKLFGMLGLLLGWRGVFNVMFFSVLCVALYGIVMIVLRRKGRKAELPIGPSTLAGMAMAILLGM